VSPTVTHAASARVPLRASMTAVPAATPVTVADCDWLRPPAG
jgi:hypothetical protein